jgi:hypothetical protein
MRQYVARTRINGLRDQAVEQEARQFGAFANTARNSPQTVNCVVGPGEVATLRADNDLQKGAGD